MANTLEDILKVEGSYLPTLTYNGFNYNGVELSGADIGCWYRQYTDGHWTVEINNQGWELFDPDHDEVTHGVNAKELADALQDINSYETFSFC